MIPPQTGVLILGKEHDPCPPPPLYSSTTNLVRHRDRVDHNHLSRRKKTTPPPKKDHSPARGSGLFVVWRTHGTKNESRLKSLALALVFGVRVSPLRGSPGSSHHNRSWPACQAAG